MAITVRTPTGTCTARQGQITIARSTNVTIGAAATLSGAFLNATYGSWRIDAGVTNITITPPETGYDKVDFFGETSSFQNQVFDQKPVGNASVACTLLVDKDELIEDLIVSGTITGIASYSRYQVGNLQTTIDDLAICMAFTTPDLAKYRAVAMVNAKMNKWGDLKLAADGHLEQDVSFVCLAKDFYYEFKD
jgi:hypothetical protein